MSKKDFTGAATQRVYAAIEEATAPETLEAQEVQETQEKPKKRYKDRKTYSPEEAQAFLDSFQSAGRKGLKLKRINMAFSEQNYEYVRRMARARGESTTAFVNWCIKEHRDQNQELYAQVQKFLEEM